MRAARTDGWRRALFRAKRDAVAAGDALADDARGADWTYLLPLGAGTRVLVLGCAWGTLPVLLASRGAQVTVRDPSAAAVGFVAVRAEQEGISGIRAELLSQPVPLPDADGSFDIVIARPEWGAGTPRPILLREVRRVTSNGGAVAWSLRNRLSPRSLVTTLAGTAARRGTLGAETRALRASGLHPVQVHAPLPDAEGPLFHVPASPAAVRYFARDLLPLVDTIAPESRGGRAGDLALRSAARAAGFPLLDRLALRLLPEWIVIARAEDRDAR